MRYLCLRVTVWKEGSGGSHRCAAYHGTQGGASDQPRPAQLLLTSGSWPLLSSALSRLPGQQSLGSPTHLLSQQVWGPLISEVGLETLPGLGGGSKRTLPRALVSCPTRAALGAATPSGALRGCSLKHTYLAYEYGLHIWKMTLKVFFKK